MKNLRETSIRKQVFFPLQHYLPSFFEFILSTIIWTYNPVNYNKNRIFPAVFLRLGSFYDYSHPGWFILLYHYYQRLTEELQDKYCNPGPEVHLFLFGIKNQPIWSKPFPDLADRTLRLFFLLPIKSNCVCIPLVLS